MGNRAIITLEDGHGIPHPVALYVHWNGGLESVLAFMEYTWATFDRGRDDLYTFHARLCQVIGNFFPDGLSLYGLPLEQADDWAEGADNGAFRFRVTADRVSLPGRDDDCARVRAHAYWTATPNILDSIKAAMPSQPKAEGSR